MKNFSSALIWSIAATFYHGAQAAESCIGTLGITAYSAGFNDGNSAMISGTGLTDSTWLHRGFNVAVFSSSTHSLVKSANFDTYSYSGSSMVSFLNSVAPGDVVVVAAEDATENWKDKGHIGDDLKMVMANDFGTSAFASLGTATTYRDSYVMIGVKGDLGPLFEQRKASGSGAVTGTASITCSDGSSSSPVSSTPVECSDLGISLSAVSGGWSESPSTQGVASLTVSYEGANSGYHDSWMGRGFNVVVFDAGSFSVVSQANFDTYGSEQQAYQMQSFMESVAHGDLVVVVVKDATEFWNTNDGPNVVSSLKSYMSSNFGTSQFNNLGSASTYRDSYAMIAFKGASSPEQERYSSAGSGTVSVYFDCEGSSGDDGSSSNDGGGDSSSSAGGLADGAYQFDVTSAGALDGSRAAFSIYNSDGDSMWQFSTSSPGFTVLAMDVSGDSPRIVSQSTFATAGSAQAQAMLIFLQSIASGNGDLLMWIVASGVTGPITNADLIAYMKSSLSSAYFEDLGPQDSFVLAVLGGEVLLEVKSEAGTGSASATLTTGDESAYSYTYTDGGIPTDPAMSYAFVQDCQAGLSFTVTASGSRDGGSDGAGSAVSIMKLMDGVASDTFYSSAWVNSGINVLIYDVESQSVDKQINFNTYANAYLSKDIIDVLSDVTSSQLVVLLTNDAIEWWDPTDPLYPHVSETFKTYLLNNFGADMSGVGSMDNYLFAGYKGGSPLVEVSTAAGTGSAEAVFETGCE
jgi:hypothetical protein